MLKCRTAELFGSAIGKLCSHVFDAKLAPSSYVEPQDPHCLLPLDSASAVMTRAFCCAGRPHQRASGYSGGHMSPQNGPAQSGISDSGCRQRHGHSRWPASASRACQQAERSGNDQAPCDTGVLIKATQQCCISSTVPGYRGCKGVT